MLTAQRPADAVLPHHERIISRLPHASAFPRDRQANASKLRLTISKAIMLPLNYKI
jgi:hypothetical protein